jgi:hypothetical protein
MGISLTYPLIQPPQIVAIFMKDLVVFLSPSS